VASSSPKKPPLTGKETEAGERKADQCDAVNERSSRAATMPRRSEPRQPASAMEGRGLRGRTLLVGPRWKDWSGTQYSLVGLTNKRQGDVRGIFLRSRPKTCP
jgi:hypothetical protein